jgi:hypothetical protein
VVVINPSAQSTLREARERRISFALDTTGKIEGYVRYGLANYHAPR